MLATSPQRTAGYEKTERSCELSLAEGHSGWPCADPICAWPVAATQPVHRTGVPAATAVRGQRQSLLHESNAARSPLGAWGWPRAGGSDPGPAESGPCWAHAAPRPLDWPWPSAERCWLPGRWSQRWPAAPAPPLRSLQMSAEISCPVARRTIRYIPLGMTNMVMLSPNSVKKEPHPVHRRERATVPVTPGLASGTSVLPNRLHIPGTRATRHFINDERLAAMKPGVILINTAAAPHRHRRPVRRLALRAGICDWPGRCSNPPATPKAAPRCPTPSSPRTSPTTSVRRSAAFPASPWTTSAAGSATIQAVVADAGPVFEVVGEHVHAEAVGDLHDVPPIVPVPMTPMVLPDRSVPGARWGRIRSV